MNHKHERFSHGAGFTLVEVLLALGIFSLMATILYGAFALGHRAVDKSQGAFDANQKLRSFGDLLAGYIRSAHPYRLSPQSPQVFFEGAEDSLRFVSAVSVAMGGRGMAVVEILREGSEGNPGPLSLTEQTPVRVGDAAVENTPRAGIQLEEDVRALRFEYLDPEGTGENWEETWDGRERRMLPRAVRLTYRTGRGNEVQWVFPVMVSVLGQ